MKFNLANCALMGVALFCGSQQVFADPMGAFDGLDPAKVAEVKAALKTTGHYAMKMPVAGSGLPEFIVFEKVAATPRQALEVFADADSHSTYFKNEGIKQSHVESKVPGAGSASVTIDYHFSYSLASDTYTSLTVISKGAKPGSYQDVWELTKSTMNVVSGPVRSHGSAVFEPLDAVDGGGTVIAYRNLVVPTPAVSWIVSFFGEDDAEKLATATADALVTEIKNQSAGTQEARKEALDQLIGAE